MSLASASASIPGTLSLLDRSAVHWDQAAETGGDAGPGFVVQQRPSLACASICSRITPQHVRGGVCLLHHWE